MPSAWPPGTASSPCRPTSRARARSACAVVVATSRSRSQSCSRRTRSAAPGLLSVVRSSASVLRIALETTANSAVASSAFCRYAACAADPTPPSPPSRSRMAASSALNAAARRS
eukprot:Amastigsp_a516985_16.p4 type:complete len:114 gc:universal Amastigsp_a516985_16:587-246(-)